MAVGLAALVVLPVADGTVGSTDRPHVCGIYAGITIGVLSANATLFDGVDGADQMVTIGLGTYNLQNVLITGIRPSGEDVVLRFLAQGATEFVRVHIQHDDVGGGGESYNASIFVSDVRVDCQTNRQQDTTITRSTGSDYFVWLIPEILVGATYTRFDGETGNGEDRMAFVTLGANSEKVEAMRRELENLNEKLERLLTHASEISTLVLDPGEK